MAGVLRAAASNRVWGRFGCAAARLVGLPPSRRWRYDNQARLTAGETPAVNPILSVLRVDGDDGKCRALLIHFATHPTPARPRENYPSRPDDWLLPAAR